MPVRIKPTYKLGPCKLTLESIQAITQLVTESFSATLFSASDGVWEIYGEPRDSFLQAVRDRSKLDSFVVNAETSISKTVRSESENGEWTMDFIQTEVPKKITIVFSEERANVEFNAEPELENWFEHFMIDLRKQIASPSFAQLMVHRVGAGDYYIGIPFLVAIPLGQLSASVPYCRIVIGEKPRNEFAENVKANLFSNIIWVIIGAVFTIVVQWILSWLNLDIGLSK